MLTRLINTFSGRDSAHEQQADSNEAFITECYRELLGRDPDPTGKQEFLHALNQGLARLALIKGIVTSSEFFSRLLAQYFSKEALPDLYHENPHRYVRTKVLGKDEHYLTFRAETPADYDWIEAMIIAHGYYDTPGIWSLVIDNDKHIIAEIMSRFAPNRCLEIGCSTGSVLKLLDDLNIYAEGVEISHLALALSYKSIRQRIHFGDLLTLPLTATYDMILGLDVFEHLNPNKLPAVAQRCFQLLQDGGFLVTNIPVFGNDPVFGDLYPIYLEPWRTQLDRGEPFSLLHVDDKGWPLQGHLIWAPSSWWQMMFEQAGFQREPSIEIALHAVYDDYFRSHSPARQSLYVFSKNLKERPIVEQIIGRIEANGSAFTR